MQTAFQPQAGAVRIDGIDIRQINPLKLRQNIAYIGQEPDFFAGTLAENMRLVKPEASDDDIIHALNKAGLEDWLNKLTDGIQSVVGDHDKSLLPQLALARAYLQDSIIMIIDEMPYEFLNSKSGQSFYDFLKNQKGKQTIFYVTYRQDYINLADKVIQFQQDQRPLVKERKDAK